MKKRKQKMTASMLRRERGYSLHRHSKSLLCQAAGSYVCMSSTVQRTTPTSTSGCAAGFVFAPRGQRAPPNSRCISPSAPTMPTLPANRHDSWQQAKRRPPTRRTCGKDPKVDRNPQPVSSHNGLLPRPHILQKLLPKTKGLKESTTTFQSAVLDWMGLVRQQPCTTLCLPSKDRVSLSP